MDDDAAPPTQLPQPDPTMKRLDFLVGDGD